MSTSNVTGVMVTEEVNAQTLRALAGALPCEIGGGGICSAPAWGWIRWEPCECRSVQDGPLVLMYCKDDWDGFFYDEFNGPTSSGRQEATCYECDADSIAEASGKL